MIQQVTDTVICIPTGGSPSRLINIIGTPANVERAKLIIRELLEEIESEREIRRRTDPITREIEVPREALGLIIGKNGDNVKTIRLVTNTLIVCPRRWEPHVIKVR